MRRFLAIFISFFIYISIFGQTYDYVELPVPTKVTPLVLKNALNYKIIYGATPPNYNGRILLLTHGFGNTVETLLENNFLYYEAYASGFKTVFTTTTIYLDDWENGAILANQIKQITSLLNVEKLTILAHSNGGRAVEVAMYQHNVKDNVEKVVTLGTPFWGTPLADMFQNPLIRWIVDFFPAGEGKKLSTTYYSKEYFRPRFDNDIFNQPEKFFTVGAWGYASRKGKYSRSYAFSGNLMKLKGYSADNDGVTTFESSRRPGGTTVLKVKDPRGDYNHMDLKQADIMWLDVIEPVLKQEVVSKQKQIVSSVSESDPYTVTSDYQILMSSLDNLDNHDYQNAWIDSNAKNIKVDLIIQEPNKKLDILSDQNKVIKKLQVPFKKSFSNEDYMYSLKINKAENFKIKAKTNYLAFVRDGLNQPMVYKIKSNQDKTILEVTFPNLSLDKLNETIVKASFNYIGDLRGKGEEGKLQTIVFKREREKFIADVSNNPVGVYSLMLNAEIPNKYRRNIISGFVIKNQSDQSESIATQKNIDENEYRLVGNPIINSSKLYLPLSLRHSSILLKVYKMDGVLVKQFNVKANTEIPVGTYLSQLPKGSYVLSINSGEKSYSINFMR